MIYFLLSSCLLLVGCSKYRLQSPAPGIWPQLFKTSARQACDTLSCSFPPTLLWQKRSSTIVGPVMIGFDEVVLFGTLDGSLEGYTLAEGKSIGKINIRSKVPVTCAYQEPYLIVLRRSGNGSLLCYDLTRAETLWSVAVGLVFGEPLITATHVFVATADGRILRLHLTDGHIGQHARVPTRFIASPALMDEVLVIGDDQGIIRAFDLTLHPLWQFATGMSIRATPVIDGGNIFIGSTNGTFYCLELFSGKVRWQTTIDGKIFQSAAVCEDKVVFGATDHTVYGLDRHTGKKIWQFKSNSVISTAPLITKNIVFIGSMDKNFYALNLHTGAIQWCYAAKGRIRSHPIIIHNYLLFAAENDYVYCFKMNSW